MIPAVVYGLTLVCPAVPAVLWTAIINAIISGDITLDHINQFMKDHNIQTYPEYPTGKNDPFDKSPDINTIPSFKTGDKP